MNFRNIRPPAVTPDQMSNKKIKIVLTMCFFDEKNKEKQKVTRLQIT
jgi:hypothetical protein